MPFGAILLGEIDIYSLLPVSLILIISKLFIMHVELLKLILVAFVSYPSFSTFLSWGFIFVKFVTLDKCL